MLDIGINLVKGIWDGIKSGWEWIGDKLEEFGNGIKNGVKKALGIKSPSVVMKKEVGVNIVLGVIEGIDATENKLKDAVQGMFSSINAGMGISPSLANNMSTSLGGMNVVVNANFETDPLGQMINKVKTFSGGAKNDYNFGMGR